MSSPPRRFPPAAGLRSVRLASETSLYLGRRRIGEVKVLNPRKSFLKLSTSSVARSRPVGFQFKAADSEHRLKLTPVKVLKRLDGDLRQPVCGDVGRIRNQNAGGSNRSSIQIWSYRVKAVVADRAGWAWIKWGKAVSHRVATVLCQVVGAHWGAKRVERVLGRVSRSIKWRLEPLCRWPIPILCAITNVRLNAGTIDQLFGLAHEPSYHSSVELERIVLQRAFNRKEVPVINRKYLNQQHQQRTSATYTGVHEEV
ncbi:hypothetical protein B0H12DRAFT_1074113 [Mycena haematopus]|nr:hypothetical protein B0H12DRAFT_1074113 [Mycena haematopus]